MRRTTPVLASCVIGAAVLSVLFKGSPRQERAVPESMPSETSSAARTSSYGPRRQVDGEQVQAKGPRDSSLTKDEFEQLPRADHDKIVESFVAAFGVSESGVSDDPAAPQPYVSLDLFAHPYMRTLTESEFGQLSPEDRETALAEIVESCRATRGQMLDVIAQAQAGRANQDYARAEAYLISGLERARELSANKDGLFITRVVGIACQKAALNEMVRLYTELGDDARVRTAQSHLQGLEAEMNQMREAAQQSQS